MERFGREGTPFPNEHLSLDRLREEIKNHGYLFNYIPPYPRPELHVTHLSHFTDLQGLQGIKRDGGFKNSKKDFKLVWWSLTMNPEDLRDAETRTMKVVQPDWTVEEFRSEEVGDQAGPDRAEAESHESFLQKFATSPAFMSSSRMGSYRFTFPLQDVLEKYSQQFCEGQKPVMRVWKTLFYKQEVVYAVLVHSPTNQERFSEFPLLQDEPDSICAFRDEPGPHFIWRPQAMSNTHSFELIKTRSNTLEASRVLGYPQFYVWDHVALALVVDDQILGFEDLELRQNLRFCEKGMPTIIPDFQSYEEAQDEVKNLWPEEVGLEKFSESHFHIYP